MLHKQVSFIVDSKGAKQAAVVPIDIYNELMTLQKALSDNKPGERELYHFNGKGAEAHGYPARSETIRMKGISRNLRIELARRRARRSCASSLSG